MCGCPLAMEVIPCVPAARAPPTLTCALVLTLTLPGWMGSEAIWACVPEDRDAEPVRSFGTCTPDLYALADWLAASRLETVALESTGVYWMPGYEMLAARGFRVHLVNARHLKHVPGRKSAVKD